jgi:hypothetical protein
MARTDSSRPSGISDRQSVVIDLLVQGATHQEASTVVGVSRTTVTGWANHHVQFIAELNVRRNARLKASADRLQAVVLKALMLVEGEVDSGDVASALALLKLVGLGQLSTLGLPGPCSPLGAEIELAAGIEAERYQQMISGSMSQDEVRLQSDEFRDE